MPTHDWPAASGTALGSAMADLAAEWIGTLTPEQQPRAVFPDPAADTESERERLRWFYTPTDHGGLSLSAQTPPQQQLTMRLVRAGLSQAAYNTVATIIGLENVLDEVEDWSVDWGRQRGRDPGLYYLRIFGKPGTAPWAWRFGGHHISLNYLLSGGALVSTTPCFIGSDPASAPLLGPHRLRPLGGTEDTARALMDSLPRAAARIATLHPSAISDIVSGNRIQVSDGDEMIHMQDLWRGPLGEERLVSLVERIDANAEAGSGYQPADHQTLALTATPKGLCAADMTAAQRAQLRGLLACYHGRAPEPIATAHALRYVNDEELDRVHFGWAGHTAPGAPHYYRLQGPDLLAEWDNTQRMGNHAHSVWRHPTNDFGLDLIAFHRGLYHPPYVIRHKGTR